MAGPNGERPAVWVYTRSARGWTQQGPPLTGDPTPYNQFGSSVALSADGNTALIGNLGDDNYLGAAYVFTRTSGRWAQQGPKLVPNDASGIGPTTFGSNAALSGKGDTALIGGSNDNLGVGAVWVFTRTSGHWTQQGRKQAGLGGSVALSYTGDTALIAGGSGDQPWDAAGAAWIFTRSSGGWKQGPKFTPSDAVGNGVFGSSAALSSNGMTALIGGSGDNDNIGAAWVFTRGSGAWRQQGPKLTAKDE